MTLKYFYKTIIGEVEVSEKIFIELENMDKKLDNSDRKYYKWNVSYDADIIVSPKYKFGASNDYDYKASFKSNSLEQIIISREKIKDINKILEKENDRNRKIIAMNIQGFTEMEIAEEIGVSQSTINKVKQRFSKEIERLK